MLLLQCSAVSGVCRDILWADATGELPVHHLKPGGGGGVAGQYLGRGGISEHVKTEWRLECCDNREFIIVSVLSFLSTHKQVDE